jgi:hypothetical protein
LAVEARVVLAGGWNGKRFQHGLYIAMASGAIAYGLIFLASHGSPALDIIAGLIVTGAGGFNLYAAHSARQLTEAATGRFGAGIAALLSIVAVALGIGSAVAEAPHGSSASGATGAGIAVNAASGKVERSPHIAAPTGSADIDGGTILHGCDLSRERTCQFDSPYKELVVQKGDILLFQMLLHNSGWTPVPYAKFFVVAGPRLEVKPPGVGVALTIAWPSKGDPTEAERPLVSPVKVRLATPTRYGFHLHYIRGSTILERRNHSVIARLPDGLFSPLGLALTNIGALKGCFDCNDQYDRFVGFKMRVE